MMSTAVKSTDTRGRQSRVVSSDARGCPSSHGVSGSMVVGGHSSSTANCPSVHGSGSALVGGGTVTALTGGSSDPARRPLDVDTVSVKLGGAALDGAHDGWNPRASMAFDSAKGLLNPVGENNCFLNSAVQVLWHLDAFRRNFRLLSGHTCMGRSCIFCALKVTFTQLQYSSCSALPPSHLRQALACSFADQQRYQLGRMDDAAECFENILTRIHKHLAHDVDEASCQELHCIPHQKFAMTIVEQAVCQCDATAEPFSFTEFVHYVSTKAMISLFSPGNRARSFGQLLNSASNDGDRRTCPKNCGGTVRIRRTLTNAPDVVSIGLVWDSERPTFEHVCDVFRIIETSLYPAEMFYSLVDADWAASTRLHLVGLVCYYGHHYSTFFFHSKMKVWILFDDSYVRKLGPDWRSVAEQCVVGLYQPLLLLYANPNVEPMDMSSAPDRIIRIPEELSAGQGFLGESHTSRRRGRVTQGNPHPLVSTALSSHDPALPRSVGRQPSFLNAVNRSDELVYRDADTRMKSSPHCRSSQDVRFERSGMYSISENEEYQQPSCTGHSVIPQPCCTDFGMLQNRRVKADDVGMMRNNVGLHQTGGPSALWEWCKQSAADAGAADIGTYIRRDDVKKVLQLRGQKTAGAAQLNQTPSGLQRGYAANRGSSAGSQQGSVDDRKGLLGFRQGSCAVYQPAADLHRLRPNADAVDSVSVSSQKDSGYRSEEDRHSGEYSSNSPTLSASNSAVSLSANSNCAVNSELTDFPDVRSLCSSYESLCSVQSGRSLPVNVETRLHTISEGSHSTTPQESSTRLRHEAKEHFTRPARAIAVCGHRQPVRADHAAVLNSKHSASSASSQHETKFNSRPVSGRHISQFPGSREIGFLNNSDGYIRHGGSVPAINRLSDNDVAASLYWRPETGCSRPCTANVVAPHGSQSAFRHRDVDQSQSAARCVQGRGYLRETGASVPSLRQPSTSKPANYRPVVGLHRTVLPANNPPWI